VARKPGDIAERLVRAARERFLLEGVDGASLRAIARDAGTNLGMVYYYFPSKDELFLACIEDVYARLLSDLAMALEQSVESEPRVAALYARLARLSDDELGVLRLLVREALVSSARLGRLFERFSRGHVALLLGLVREGVGRGELRADLPPMTIALSILALGSLPQIIARRLREANVPVEALGIEADSLRFALTEVVLRGIAAAKSELIDPRGSAREQNTERVE
jgi:AcrR family transcriptional regulator